MVKYLYLNYVFYFHSINKEDKAKKNEILNEQTTQLKKTWFIQQQAKQTQAQKCFYTDDIINANTFRQS